MFHLTHFFFHSLYDELSANNRKSTSYFGFDPLVQILSLLPVASRWRASEMVPQVMVAGDLLLCCLLTNSPNRAAAGSRDAAAAAAATIKDLRTAVVRLSDCWGYSGTTVSHTGVAELQQTDMGVGEQPHRKKQFIMRSQGGGGGGGGQE